MTNYNLLIVEKHKTLSETARGRPEMLALFGKKLGVPLTLEDNGTVPPYLLDEWEESPHWVNCTIPVYVKTTGAPTA